MGGVVQERRSKSARVGAPAPAPAPAFLFTHTLEGSVRCLPPTRPGLSCDSWLPSLHCRCLGHKLTVGVSFLNVSKTIIFLNN